jgi:site-specific DNA recombinase
MGPTYAKKGGVRYRYYLSSPLIQGAPDQAGSVRRVPAAEIERMVVERVRDHIKPLTERDDRTLIATHVTRVEVQRDQLVVRLTVTEKSADANDDGQHSLTIPWQKPPSKRRRELLLPQSSLGDHVSPIRAETRATLVAAIARGRRWLNELVTDAHANPARIAKREGCSARKINMTISLAFLAPDLVKAAVDGRLPHGLGITRLCDMPVEWSRQYEMLGLSNNRLDDASQ